MNTMTTFPVTTPLTGKVIGEAPDMGREETIALICKAQEAFTSWSHTTPKERIEIFKRWHTLTLENVKELATLLHQEQGKSMEEAEEEIHDGALFFDWYGAEAQRIHGYTALSPDPQRRMMTIKQPIGVVGVITPWNFPSALPLQKCLPALAAGCTVVLKPSEVTPLSSLAHYKLAQEAGLPDGVFNIITCQDPTEVGAELSSNPLIRKLTFTGSTDVGRKLIKQSGSTVKKLSLELGGNSPLILFDDGNLDLAVEKALGLKFYNAGQVCNNINRFFIHASQHDMFIQKFQKGMESLTLAPLATPETAEKIERLLHDAQSKGARTIGQPPSQPTLVLDATPEMALFHEEIFGPIAPIYTFDDEEEVIALANDTEYGLAAYLFSESIGRCHRIAEKLEAGSVGINTTDIYSELLPFGGWKQSGLSREMGLEKGLDDFLETKSLVIGNL